MKATVYPITDATPNHIAIVARPRGNDWLCEEISALSGEGIDILVSMLTDEEAEELGLNAESAECTTAGISFVNVPIPGLRELNLAQPLELHRGLGLGYV